MNAAKFIADKGWDLAQRDVVCLEAGFITKADFLEHYGFEILDEMKIYVDAWELVESKGGLCQAKKHYLDIREAINQVYYSHSCEFESQELKKAITLVEEVKSLKEVS